MSRRAELFVPERRDHRPPGAVSTETQGEAGGGVVISGAPVELSSCPACCHGKQLPSLLVGPSCTILCLLQPAVRLALYEI